MNTLLLTEGRAGRPALLPLFLFFFLLLLSVFPASAQEKAKQPTLSQKVVRVGYLDHTRLRKEFTAMKTAHEQARTDWQASEAAHQKALKEASEAEHPTLKESQREKRKRLQRERTEQLRALESRITEALREVVSEGGYTDIKPLKKGEAPQQGTDITGLVLQKLN